MRETTGAEERTQDQSTTATRTARKPRATARTRTKTSAKASGAMPPTAIAAKEPNLFGRITILDVRPDAQDAVFPARVELGEPFTVSAQVFLEGRATVRATAVLKNPRGRVMARVPMTQTNTGLDTWTAMLQAGSPTDLTPWDEGFADMLGQLGNWKVAIEGWADTYTDWVLDATARVNADAGSADAEGAIVRGSEILTRWAATRDAGLDAAQRKVLRETAKQMLDATIPTAERLAIAQIDEIAALHTTNPLRDGLTASRDRVFHVERPKSSFSAWYQFFPRSEGATVNERGETTPGTLRTAISGLERAKSEGFTIAYLPTVFPVDHSAPDARLFAVGTAAGGHDTVDPQLGSMDDFKAFCARAHELGLEVALGLPLRCAPTHPWVAAHPEWFRRNTDSSFVHALDEHGDPEPFYELDFDNDLTGIEREVERIIDVWIEAGVTAFQIDKPQTEPVRFWQDVLAAVTKKHPEVLFLAEAFSRPALVRALAYAGFTQNHSYFPWRNTKEELEAFLTETNGEGGFYQHNTFWPATPDVLSDYLRNNGVAGHAVRAVLAAMGSPSWGIYNGYELMENNVIADGASALGNERTEVRARDWSGAVEYGIAELLTSLNRIRTEHPATRSYHTLTVLPSANPAIVAFARQTPAQYTADGKPDTLLIVVNLDCYHEQQSSIHVDLNALGLPADRTYRVRDLLTNRTFDWSWDNFVSLAPWADVAHILSVEYW